MEQKEFNPPAFPGTSLNNSPNQGMTLRDYFAAQYMNGIVSKMGFCFSRDIARNAYQFADAMLEERQKSAK